MERKKKILFVYITLTTFVKTDLDILSEKYLVTKYQFKPQKGPFKVGFEMIKQFVFLLINIWKFDAIYIWFADSHSFLPVFFAHIFRKKSYLVIGGFDVARLRSLHYGVFTSRIRGFFAIFSMNYCTLNLTVSKYVDRKVKWIARKSNTYLLYNCIEFDEKSNQLKLKKEDLIVTVGVIEKEQTYYLKGIDSFIDVARMLPQYKFLIIGINKEKLAHLLINLPDNLIFKKKIPHHELIEYYKKAKIYCQFSRSESFGISIVEAMNFECLPVVTNVGGMPEVVGKTGEITKRDLGIISNKIKKGINDYSFFNIEAKQRIVTNFNRTLREESIIKILED